MDNRVLKMTLTLTGFVALFAVGFGLIFYWTAASVIQVGMEAAAVQSMETRVVWTSVGLVVLFLLPGAAGAFLIARKAVAESGQAAPSGSREAGAASDGLGTSVSGLAHDTMHEISQLSDNVAATAQSLAGNTEFCSDMVVGISESIQQIAVGSESIAESARGNMFMLEEVSRGMRHIAESSQGLANETSEVAQKANEGKLSVEQAIAQMGIITDAALASATAVGQMDARTEQIDQVTVMMAEIASQIHLLSLNAAIEAARVGEHGRGFAVVASEIRKLADKSASSVKEIDHMMAYIRSGSQGSREAMDQVMSEIQTGADFVGVAGQSFQEIVNLTEQVSYKVQEVSGVTEEVSASAEQILGSVQETVTITEMALAGAKEIAACSDEQLTAMEDSLQSARKLEEQAKQLKSQIDINVD